MCRKLLIVVACLCLLSSPAICAEKPNIIVILSDDMGFSDLGCYGGEIDTPNLDRLAAGGLRFTQFYNTGRCCPTRACLLSGLYPHQAGVGHMMADSGFDGYRGNINRRCVTMAEALKPAGYGTYMVGKWHITRHIQPDGPKDNWPRQRGFDRFYGTITGAGSFFDPGTLVRDNTNLSPFADPQYQPKQFYYTDAISDHAVRFLDEHQTKQEDSPFFLYVAYTAAHWPMHALEKDIAKYKGKFDDGYAAYRKRRFDRVKKLGLIDPKWKMSPTVGKWENVEHKEWEARCMEVYAAMIDNMDQGIGRIVKKLETNKQLDNTLIFFMQDNGGCQEGVGRSGKFKRPVEPSLPEIAKDAIRLDVIPKQNRAGVPTLKGPHIMPGPADTYIAYGINWANVSNTPFREYKHFVHEGGISTPLIVHWPSGLKRKGELEQQPGHLIDIMATCVDVSGAKYPTKVGENAIQPLEGRSLAPTFEGKQIEREAIYWEHEGNRALRMGKWKLVAKGAKGKWELYDMEADRTESNDLAGKEPARVEEMSAKWDAWAKRANVLPLTPYYNKGKNKRSKQVRFNLKQGANLPQAEAPNVENRPFTIAVSVAKLDEPGVLVAQGGSAHGYSLYYEAGSLIFATRIAGKIRKIRSGKGLSTERRANILVRVAKDGTATLSVNEDVVATGQVGLMTEMPIDGLQVGQDAKGNVSDYEVPFRFGGKIEKVIVELQ